MTPEEIAELDKLPRWGLEEKPMEQVTILEFEELIHAAVKREQNIISLTEKLEEEKAAKDAILHRAQSYLTHFGKSNYQSAFGTVELRTRLSFRTPKSLDEKRAFFEWLTERGAYWEYVGINSTSLNSLCKGEFETAQEEGRECKIPGIQEPTEFTQIVLKLKNK